MVICNAVPLERYPYWGCNSNFSERTERNKAFRRTNFLSFDPFQTSSAMAVQSRRESLSSLYKFNPPHHALPPPPAALPPPPPPPTTQPPDPLDVSSYTATPKANRYLANSKSSSNLYYGGGVNQLNNNVILPSASSAQPFSVDQVQRCK